MEILNKNKCFAVIFLATSMLLSACASRPAKTEPPVYGPQPAPVESTPPTGEATKPAEPAPSLRPGEKLRVTLALGGAGVASFATVGLLKRLQEEGIAVDAIISTGWPTLFALGFGFLRSVHDLEWFAMRLQEKDFYKAGLFADKNNAGHEQLSELIESAFRQRTLGETSVPVWISATNTELGDQEVYESGDWKEPLLKTMSVPGIYRPYPKSGGNEWVQSLQGIDVSAAQQKGAKVVVAVSMYGDYFKQFARDEKDPGQKVFRQLYLSQMKKSLQKELRQAAVSAEIALGRPANDFTAKRAAILAGYKEGAKIAKMLKTLRPAVN